MNNVTFLINGDYGFEINQVKHFKMVTLKEEPKLSVAHLCMRYYC